VLGISANGIRGHSNGNLISGITMGGGPMAAITT
jgi:hypothetical protein